jgi:hypothetical protein
MCRSNQYGDPIYSIMLATETKYVNVGDMVITREGVEPPMCGAIDMIDGDYLWVLGRKFARNDLARLS